MDSKATDSALIVEGGALRGVFSTGLLDGFLDARFNPFNFYIGVSSGATNLAAYLAGMSGRNYRIYTDYALRPEFIDSWRFLKGGHLMDLDWLWDVTIREMRLDLAEIYSRGRPFLVGLTDVSTGAPVCKTTDKANIEQILKVSSAMPVLYRGCPELEGRPMGDGGITDAIPFREAVRRGARRIMVVRSRSKNYVKTRGVFDLLLKWHFRKYPMMRKALAVRVERYNRTVALIRKPPPGVAAVEICPPPGFRVSRLSRNLRILQEGYRQGRDLAVEAIETWQRNVA